MDDVKKIQKFITDENSKIGWLVCISTGSPVRSDSNWVLRDGSLMHDGFKSVRILKGDDSIYKVVCSIGKTTMGLPLFKVTAFKLLENNTFSSVEEKSITGLKMTPLSNQIISDLNVNTTKRWSGVKFFGLDRTDVKRILTTWERLPLIEAAGNSNETNCSSTELIDYDGDNCHCPWIGVQCFGHVVSGEFSDAYIKEFNGARYNVRRGYISSRGVKCSTGKVFVVTCKVLLNGPLPNYVCEANENSIQSENITTAVSKILKSIGAVTLRHWSGYEFFGFHRKDVLNVLRLPDRNRDSFEDDRLLDIQNIRLRNAGPTDDLKSKQAIEKRNSKINAVVDYASFGDVKSIFSFFL